MGVWDSDSFAALRALDDFAARADGDRHDLSADNIGAHDANVLISHVQYLVNVTRKTARIRENPAERFSGHCR